MIDEMASEKTPLLSKDRLVRLQHDTNDSGSVIATEAGHKKLTPNKSCVVGTILSTELCERLTFYSIQGNLVLFLTNYLQFSSTDAVTISLIFQGINYIKLLGSVV